jgi:NADH dehydrogenase/NADH:ubiquinone oxidoreductase subunit G
MMKITVNGLEREAHAGESILDLCRREGVPIPTFCYHQAFGGQGACRMCMVEIKEAGQARSRLVAACTYPLTGPAEITTESEQILRIRRTITMLLARRAGENPLLEEMSRTYGAVHLPAITVEPANCILCGLCIHACEEMGKSAIWSMFRGVDKRIATPYDEASDDCMGCAACARVCPTQAIKMEEEGAVRKIWNKTFKLLACSRCGRHYATKEELEYLSQRGDFGQQKLCEPCRKKNMAYNMKTFQQ